MVDHILFRLSLLGALLGVAFYTLLERKVLSLCQIRKGPNKVSLLGILQPLADGIKLFVKENIMPSNVNKFLFTLSPVFIIIFRLLIWLSILPEIKFRIYQFSLLVFLVLSGLIVFPLFLAAWSCNSLYSILGALRITAQTISYEISLIFILIFIAGAGNHWKVTDLNSYPLLFTRVPLFAIFLLTVVAETHRAPFDFAEGERELVRGYNLEFSGAAFSILFLSEYLNILFMSVLTSYLWFANKFLAVFIFTFILRLRASYPRLRYDLLISLCWLVILPYSILALSKLGLL